MRVLIEIVLGCFVVGGLLMYVSCRRAAPGVCRERFTKYGVYFAVVMAVLGAAALGKVWLQGGLGAIIVLGAVEVRAALHVVKEGERGSRSLVWGGYFLLAGAAWIGLDMASAGAVAYVYVVVAVFDGFSQVTGQLLGRHKLAPKVSPGKTVEGAAGGLLIAVGAAILAASLVGLDLLAAVRVGVLACLAALVGDLSASWLKRRAGIKDYGKLLPGHGGVLDRFDSFLPALAACGPWLAGGA